MECITISPKVKNEISRKNKISGTPKIVDIIAAIPDKYKNTLIPILKVKPIRTASGIAVVAVMCKPHRCPHIATTGNICVYCPGVSKLNSYPIILTITPFNV